MEAFMTQIIFLHSRNKILVQGNNINKNNITLHVKIFFHTKLFILDELFWEFFQKQKQSIVFFVLAVECVGDIHHLNYYVMNKW